MKETQQQQQKSHKNQNIREICCYIVLNKIKKWEAIFVCLWGIKINKDVLIDSKKL